MKAKIIVTLYY